MGLSIHYSGQISNYTLIENLVNECEDICRSLEWDYHILEKKSNANDEIHLSNPTFISYTIADLKGISFTPKDSETVSLVFFPSGKICSPVKLMYNDPATNDLMVETVSVKTQYAGMDVHLTILKLLQYLKDKYFSVFELSDEGMYWETKDIEILKSQFARYDFIVNSVRNALSDFKAQPGETPGSLADRLEAFFKKQFGSNEQ